MRPEYLELLKTLISFAPVTSDIPAVNRTASYLADFIAKKGLRVHVVDTSSGRKGLYVSALPTGYVSDYLFVAHLDVVPLSTPLQSTPVEKDGMILVDGGILSRIPVAQARDLGAEKVVAVDVLGALPPYTEIKNIVNVALRAVDVSDHRPVYMWKPKDTPDLSVNPDFKNLSQYKVEEQKFIYEQGYLSGLAAVPEIKRMIEEE